jgi:dihydroorotase
MGLSKLSITYKNKTDHYTLNNELDDHVLDGVIENIFKHYPKDITTDIVDGIPSAELTRKTLDNIIKLNNHEKTN